LLIIIVIIYVFYKTGWVLDSNPIILESSNASNRVLGASLMSMYVNAQHVAMLPVRAWWIISHQWLIMMMMMMILVLVLGSKTAVLQQDRSHPSLGLGLGIYLWYSF